MTSKPTAGDGGEQNIFNLKRGFPKSATPETAQQLLDRIALHAANIASFEWENQKARSAPASFSTTTLESLGQQTAFRIKASAERDKPDTGSDAANVREFKLTNTSAASAKTTGGKK